MKTDDQIRSEVREHYSAVARGEARTGCCAPTDTGTAARALGYSADEVAAAPAGANLGLGCGNPQAIAALRPGEVVVDLGSGGGFDCFLAARAVGPQGRVIGVDSSADMIALARGNATKQDAGNVEFRLGEIEHLPVADESADVVISNCVVNLAPDKRAVFGDVLRVLKPGGRLRDQRCRGAARAPRSRGRRPGGALRLHLRRGAHRRADRAAPRARIR